MNTNLSTVVQGYLEYQAEVRKLKPLTLNDVRCTFRNLERFCRNSGLVKEIFECSLQEYIRWVNYLQEEEQSPKSINKMLSHVRSLIDYAWQIERLDRNVLSGFNIKMPEKTPIFESLSIEEAQALMKSYNKFSSTDRRNRMILLLLYGCGLRTNELCLLDVTSIDLEKQEIKIFGKGDKERVLPLSEALFAEILIYLSDRKAKKGSLFKTHHKSKRIRPKDVGDVVEAAAHRAELSKKITPKTLRHAFASHLLNQGVDIGVISVLMGHRSPMETGVYIHAEESALRSAVFKMEEKKEDLL